jgi:hypothetical protein
MNSLKFINIPRIIQNFGQTLLDPSMINSDFPSRQMDNIYSKHYHPVYRFVDREWLRYTNYPYVESTNCIEGLVLGYFNMTPEQINDYSKEMIKDSKLLDKLEQYNKKEHAFLKNFLNECIGLTKDDINIKYDKIFWSSNL